MKNSMHHLPLAFCVAAIAVAGGLAGCAPGQTAEADPASTAEPVADKQNISINSADPLTHILGPIDALEQHHTGHRAALQECGITPTNPTHLGPWGPETTDELETFLQPPTASAADDVNPDSAKVSRQLTTPLGHRVTIETYKCDADSATNILGSADAYDNATAMQYDLDMLRKDSRSTPEIDAMEQAVQECVGEKHQAPNTPDIPTGVDGQAASGNLGPDHQEYKRFVAEATLACRHDTNFFDQAKSLATAQQQRLAAEHADYLAEIANVSADIRTRN